MTLDIIAIITVFQSVFCYDSIQSIMLQEDFVCLILFNTSHISMGQDSAVNIVIRYRLDGLGLKSWWGRSFPNLSRPGAWPTQPLLQRVLVYSQG